MLNPEISKQEELRNRSKQFGFRIISLFQKLPRSPGAQILGKQLMRSGTSVGANYRAVGQVEARIYSQDRHRRRGSRRDCFLARMPC
jgi:four helix bundle protein